MNEGLFMRFLEMRGDTRCNDAETVRKFHAFLENYTPEEQNEILMVSLVHEWRGLYPPIPAEVFPSSHSLAPSVCSVPDTSVAHDAKNLCYRT